MNVYRGLLLALPLVGCSEAPPAVKPPPSQAAFLGSAERGVQSTPWGMLAVTTNRPALTQNFPRYPVALRRAGISGVAVIEALLDETGHVVDARVYQPSGHSEFDEAALVAVRSSRYSPYTENGETKKAVALQTITFTLSNIPGR